MPHIESAYKIKITLPCLWIQCGDCRKTFLIERPDRNLVRVCPFCESETVATEESLEEVQ